MPRPELTDEDRMVAAMRLLLATSGLIVVWLDPAEPSRFVPMTYGFLLAYVSYSSIIYALARGRRLSGTFSSGWSHWLDLAWFAALIALSSGTQSIFFFGFLFSIIVASFRRGFKAGLLVTMVSVVVFGLVAFVSTPAATVDLSRLLLRPVYLLVMGYMIAYWGGYQVSLLKRLALLNEVVALRNPRFGIERTMENALQRLRAFYGADACLVVAPSDADDAVVITRVTSTDTGEPFIETEATREAARPLLSLHHDAAVAFAAKGPVVGDVRVSAAYNVAAAMTEEQLVAIRELLEADSFLTVPWPPRGRLFVVFRRRRPVRASELVFLRQFTDHVRPTLENVRLVDRLASDAADRERQRIARDLHDSVIQPYIALRIGLHAIRQKVQDALPIEAELERLETLLATEIDELRQYLSGLKLPEARTTAFLDAVRRFSQRFTEATGIEVDLHVPDTAVLTNDRLSAEMFQMIVEALSNVRRHTESTSATVVLKATTTTLRLEILDNGTAGQPARRFTPVSLTERVAALGGRLTMEPRPRGGAAISIEIPL